MRVELTDASSSCGFAKSLWRREGAMMRERTTGGVCARGGDRHVPCDWYKRSVLCLTYSFSD